MTVPFTSTQAQMLLRLHQFYAYAAGWNRPDTRAPSPMALQDAECFVRSHDLPSLPFPHISAANDGEINFWWDGPGFWVDLGFYGDGTYSLYSSLANSPHLCIDTAPLAQPLPAEILRWFEEATP